MAVVFAVTVPREELVRALEVATSGVRKGKGAEVSFSLVDDFFELRGPIGVQSCHVLRCEAWPAVAIVDAMMMKQLASRVPKEDPSELRIEGGRLFIAGFSVGVRHGASIVDGSNIARNPGRARTTNIVPELSSTKMHIVPKEVERDIKRAAAVLKPYGVSDALVRELISYALRRRNEL